MKRLLYFIIYICSIYNLSSQNIQIAVYQDIRLATIGDNRGNGPYTPDILAKIDLFDFKEKFAVSPTFEYARLQSDNYRRYAINLGYNFKLPQKFNIHPYAGWGFISRWGNKSFFSGNISMNIDYALTKKFRVTLLVQNVHRVDLKWAYGDNKIVTSAFLGIKYIL